MQWNAISSSSIAIAELSFNISLQFSEFLSRFLWIFRLRRDAICLIFTGIPVFRSAESQFRISGFLCHLRPPPVWGIFRYFRKISLASLLTAILELVTNIISKVGRSEARLPVAYKLKNFAKKYNKFVQTLPSQTSGRHAWVQFAS